MDTKTFRSNQMDSHVHHWCYDRSGEISEDKLTPEFFFLSLSNFSKDLVHRACCFPFLLRSNFKIHLAIGCTVLYSYMGGRGCSVAIRHLLKVLRCFFFLHDNETIYKTEKLLTVVCVKPKLNCWQQHLLN